MRIWRGAVFAIVCLAAVGATTGAAAGTQIDYLYSERIDNQEWSIEFDISRMSESSFSIRLPYPDYTYNGRWGSYATSEIAVGVTGDCGPVLFELHHYNEGESNQGIWLEVVCPCHDNTVSYSVTQSGKLELPGLDYPLTFHTNNPWMTGTDIVDAYSATVDSVLREALALDGDWHRGGGRSVPEKIVNWMNLNMTWGGGYVDDPKSASQVLTERMGHCAEWAHAACALLIRAGIPAKAVMAGPTQEYNSTPFSFSSSEWHLCTAYWDGFGWIMIDPQASSGFAIVNRVVLAADRDSRTIKMEVDPPYLKSTITNTHFDYTAGNHAGGLSYAGSRLNACLEDILEHYEDPSIAPREGLEPSPCVVPNVVTAAGSGAAPRGNIEIANYPNPFNPSTTFEFVLARADRVRIDLFSVDGRWIETIADGRYDAGRTRIAWNTGNLSSGIYFARVRSRGGISTKKLVILR